MKLRKKLIEVALPLDAINKASAREKSIRHGHPSTLHLWWARRPLAAARAVIFSQMVDDPSEYVDTLKMDDKLRRRAENELKKRHKVWEEQTAVKEKADAAGIESPDPGPEPTLDEILAEQERDRLFKIIEELVLWENTTNETVLDKARAEIWQSWRRTCADNADHPRAKELFDRNKLPAFHDPFAGGGALPLEAQRLGLEAYASDLNPVPVLINKAMIEIPPKFSGREPVNPEWQSKSAAEKELHGPWKGAQGLAEDVRYYGKWMRDEAQKRVGYLYPKIEITEEMATNRPDLDRYVGKELTVIAWIWARTVKSPNPAFSRVNVPLVSTFMLSTKPGKEAFVEPTIRNGSYDFAVRMGRPQNDSLVNGTSAGKRKAFVCLMSETPIPYEYIRTEAKEGRMGSRLMGVIAEGERGRVYLSPDKEMESVAEKAAPTWRPDSEMPKRHRNFQPPVYGMNNLGDIFTNRQLVALTTFSDLISEAQDLIKRDQTETKRGAASVPSSSLPDALSIDEYSLALSIYLAFAVDKVVDGTTTLCVWSPLPTKLHIVNTFGRQALPMTWDFAESNPFADSSGNFLRMCSLVSEVLERQSPFEAIVGSSEQQDASRITFASPRIISTDPPYYDNIAYADLSDFFYVWLRRSLKPILPELFSTLSVPKAEELVAMAHRHNNEKEAEEFFLKGMTQAMRRLALQGHSGFPVSIYYAFKQSESDAEGATTSTGWDTFLDAVIRAGFGISGTWPVRTERSGGFRNKDQNALASSIVLVCRKRLDNAPTVTRREFINALKSELPEALRHLQRGNIAPVDLAQAAIGPGMAVFTRYEKVLDAEGNKLSVREALALINQTLDEVLAEQEGDFDADTRWALTWFEENGFEPGEYGRAEQLSKAKNTSISEMADPKTSPILEAKGGKVRLFRPAELEKDWSPETDGRLTVWDMVHQLIRVLEKDGETAAAGIVKKLGAKAETARELCYRLYTICERKKRANDALSYNALVQSWPEIVRLAAEQATSTGGEKQILPGM